MFGVGASFSGNLEARTAAIYNSLRPTALQKACFIFTSRFIVLRVP
jgi:hypothetical protein